MAKTIPAADDACPEEASSDVGACPDDEALLAFVSGELDASAVACLDAHLDRCAECRDVVAALQGGDLVSAPRLRERAELPDEVGRFVVEGRIGEGAMGVVLGAHDPELARPVALKLLHPHRRDRRARLVREARAMAKLSHPNVVTVYEVGTYAGGLFVAMERVDGTDLRVWLHTTKPSPDAILDAFRQAGQGLAAAHRAGLVHRDFKPENVLVQHDGLVKVGDFGLARDADGPDEVAAAKGERDADVGDPTRTGTLLGTPAYMAPEQLDGAPAGPAADQFAFCVALWEALTGARPFEDARTLEALKTRIAAGPPPVPQGVPRHVARALRRGLSSDPAARFPDLASLLVALAPRRRRLGPWIAAASLLSVGGLALVVVPDASPCLDRATARASLAPADAGWSAGVRGALDAFAETWADTRVGACEATHVRHELSEEGLARRVRCLDRAQLAYDAARDALASSRGREDAILAALPDPRACNDDALQPPPALREAADALAERLDRASLELAAARPTDVDALVNDATALGYAPLRARALRLRASARLREARLEDAAEDAQAALLAADAVGDDRGVAEAWLDRVRIAGARGRFDDAADHARHAEAASTRLGDPADLREALLRVRGVVRTSLGELDGAETDLREALRLAELRPGAERGSLHAALGDLARVDGRYDEALAAHEAALAADVEAWGEKHPRVARDLHNLGGVLRARNRPNEARARYEAALAIVREVSGEEHPDFALTSNSLGLLAFEAGDDAKAREHWERAERIFAAHGHDDLALVRYNLALLELRAEDFERAAMHARAAIAIDERRLGADSKRVGGELLALGRAARGSGARVEARAAFERARRIGAALADPPLFEEASAELARLDADGSTPRRTVPVPVPVPVPAVPPAEPEPEPAPVEPPPPAFAPGRNGSAAYGPSRAWE